MTACILQLMPYRLEHAAVCPDWCPVLCVYRQCSGRHLKMQHGARTSGSTATLQPVQLQIRSHSSRVLAGVSGCSWAGQVSGAEWQIQRPGCAQFGDARSQTDDPSGLLAA